MSVKFVLLSLLQQQAASTYQLRSRFEAATGHTWNLNIGQVSTTLQRLERDGLVQRQPGENETDTFLLTTAGASELRQWWDTPVDRTRPERSELVMKIVAATLSANTDLNHIIQIQRRHLIETMRDYTRLKRQVGTDLTWRLVLENHLCLAEAELRWLDQVQNLLSTHSLATANRNNCASTWEQLQAEPRTREPVVADISTPTSEAAAKGTKP